MINNRTIPVGLLMLFGLMLCMPGMAQQVYFFAEGTTNGYYDQGLVDLSSLGESQFEYTFPPGAPQYNDKLPCSETAFQGQSALKFNYTSSESGNWIVRIHRPGWENADLTALDSIACYIYSENELPSSALPLIGLRVAKSTGADDDSRRYALGAFNPSIPAQKWTRITFPIKEITSDPENSALDFTRVKAIVFGQSEKNGLSRLLLVDEISAFKSLEQIPPVEDLQVAGYDSHVELNWTAPQAGLTYKIYASFDGGENYTLRQETTENNCLDFVPEEGKNATLHYRVSSVYQGAESSSVDKSVELEDYTDDQLLDMTQEYAFRYFWEGAHQASGMALERSNGNGRTVASGATGMGLMAMIVAHEREYRPKEQVKDRILMILDFLENCERHHGAWSHWYDGNTLKTQAFTPDDDGGDLVETSFVAQALIALRNYFQDGDTKSVQIREKATQLWKEIEWSWYQQDGQQVLYWHWSPRIGFEKNLQVSGWNESLVTYVMAASSPTYGINKEVYEQGWARNGNMVRPRTFYNYPISLAPDWGGPLFWIHYAHLGLDPKGLKDQYADYWTEHVNTARIHHAYAVANPMGFKNYSERCWGLTASDDPGGYSAHQPYSNDNGTISPTAALSSMPYTPEESLRALKYFYRERGQELFGEYGPYDAFNDERNWVQESYIGIDQGPIVVMLENYRTGLLWDLVMQDDDVQAGLDKLGFDYQLATDVDESLTTRSFQVYPNPAANRVYLVGDFQSNDHWLLEAYTMDGRMVWSEQLQLTGTNLELNCGAWAEGLYLLRIQNDKAIKQAKLLIKR
ncbi:glucoamylase family protein [uncultured Sunxiuqinia sp.]|uniref:glucoamylase family protein n=1 Tax=uncultured Sunxiuqinia sp. TaxID=1573825 RepID=UPI00261BDC5E|nr:glucoamylase family protein [uncultured Sunxiuqinia sp.]